MVCVNFKLAHPALHLYVYMLQKLIFLLLHRFEAINTPKDFCCGGHSCLKSQTVAAMETSNQKTDGAPPAKRAKTNKRRRSKRTQPKPRAEETPQRSHHDLELSSGIRSTATQESDDDNIENIQEFDLSNYRRFSARSRKKTNFFIIGNSDGQAGSSPEGNSRPHILGTKRKKGSTPSVCRALFHAEEPATGEESSFPEPSCPPESVKKPSPVSPYLHTNCFF